MTSPLVFVKDLVKTFEVQKKAPGLMGAVKGLFSSETVTLTAVDGVSFSLARGEMVGYIGPNGAGKSTTIKMLTGILTPTAGTLEVDGMVPFRDRRTYTRRIGVVFGQRTQLWWDIAVVESFRLLKEIYEISDHDYGLRMKEFDELLEIGRYLDQPVRKLSLGERMRCDLAASLLHAPPLLFLDEPTIGLDVVAKANVRAFLAEVNRTLETTVILTTHDLDDIEELCQRVLLIDHGKLLYDGPISGLRDRYLPEVRIRFDLKDSALSGKRLEISGIEAENLGQNRFQVVVDLRKMASADVIREVVNRYPVVDLSVFEPDIEEVVGRIYKDHGRALPGAPVSERPATQVRASSIRRG
ncbi:MAG: ATP-binding cassette domain-containing protein [Thermoanaerobaculia bacterium]|nr:ATP-binding cassette domain-containing protein [Thermoanaerobaculia bacterium]